MLLLVFISLCGVLTARVRGQTCSISTDCAASQCCRNTQTNATLVYNPSSNLLNGLSSQTGQCVAGGAGPGEGCDNHCTCPQGYECYAPLTGVCCGNPGSCYTVLEATILRLRDRCFPPPVAPNPGAGGSPGGDIRKRRSLPFGPTAVSGDLPCHLLLLFQG